MRKRKVRHAVRGLKQRKLKLGNGFTARWEQSPGWRNPYIDSHDAYRPIASRGSFKNA